MKPLTALLLATSALVFTPGLAAAGKADVEGGSEFFWVGETPSETSDGPTGDAPEASPRPTQRPERTGTAADAKGPSTPNPLMESYPEDAPRAGGDPAPANPLYADCFPTEGEVETGYVRHQTANPAASGARRGAQVGDDGVLEAIQDDPCAHLYRRGGETAESAAGYTHPDDIRRANTLEERRIPVHDVGRVAHDQARGDAWARSSDDRYIDARTLWKLRKGRMLSEVLTAWGEQADFDVIWRSSHDFVVRADADLRGTFPEVAGEVIESFADATPPITGDLYPANRVLVVDTANALDRR